VVVVVVVIQQEQQVELVVAEQARHTQVEHLQRQERQTQVVEVVVVLAQHRVWVLMVGRDLLWFAIPSLK
jgi:hypothetical protein